MSPQVDPLCVVLPVRRQNLTIVFEAMLEH